MEYFCVLVLTLIVIRHEILIRHAKKLADDPPMSEQDISILKAQGRFTESVTKSIQQLYDSVKGQRITLERHANRIVALGTAALSLKQTDEVHTSVMGRQQKDIDALTRRLQDLEVCVSTNSARSVIQ